jgi:hypothetical protein
VEILSAYPRTCGIIVHVADAKSKRSAIIEYTADDIAVRFAEPQEDMLWTTNHFNCYPGWQGYSGFNMPAANNDRLGLEDISSVEKWQHSLEKIGKGKSGRYGRYHELLKTNHGNMDIDIAKGMISDRYSRKQDRVLAATEPTDWDDYPIMARQHDWEMSDDISFYKNDKQGPLLVSSGNVSSFFAKPGEGDIWWTVGVPPSGCTMVYTYMNLQEELARSR